MSADPFSNSADSADDPSGACYAVTPGDTELPTIAKALYVGTGGDLVVRPVHGDSDVTFRNLPSGMILPVRAKWVRASSTAADIVALL